MMGCHESLIQHTAIHRHWSRHLHRQRL